MNPQHPFHPIIYVRGFAATQGEIEETVADPYMGFNIGSTKSRMAWTGEVKRFYFESPLVRLMSDHDYEVDGFLFMNRHYEGGYILRDLILVEAFPDEAALGGWRIKYGYQDDNPGKPGLDVETRPIGGVGGGDPKADSAAEASPRGIAFDIPVAQKTKPGLKGTLRIEARTWS